MAGVPYVFGNATTSIPLTNLDANFNTGLTIGNTTVGLGNTVTTLGNVTLTNVNIVSGTVPAPTSIANGTSNVSISSSGGNINVVTGGTIATFPQSTGTVMVSGNQPAFSAYGNTDQTISNGVTTKVIINAKTFDTATAYDATTNYRFTPKVAGYYQVNAIVEAYAGGTPITTSNTYLYKNGSEVLRGSATTNSTNTEVYNNLSGLIYMNGSTDYLELYMYVASLGTIILYSGNTYKNFNGCLIRTA